MESNKSLLREKIKKKRQQRTSPKPPEIPLFDGGETDIVKMMDQVNKILQTNPQMVQQISKCVSNVMGNKELMESLAGQLNS